MLKESHNNLLLYNMRTISVQAAMYKSMYSDSVAELCYICTCHAHQ